MWEEVSHMKWATCPGRRHAPSHTCSLFHAPASVPTFPTQSNTNWGYGVLVGVMRLPTSAQSQGGSGTAQYKCDILLVCDSASVAAGSAQPAKQGASRGGWEARGVGGTGFGGKGRPAFWGPASKGPQAEEETRLTQLTSLHPFCSSHLTLPTCPTLPALRRQGGVHVIGRDDRHPRGAAPADRGVHTSHLHTSGVNGVGGKSPGRTSANRMAMPPAPAWLPWRL